MIRSFLSGAFFLLWSIGVSAQSSLVVRSGEHTTFTRLTVNLSQEMQWQIASTANTLKLELSEPFQNLDSSTVFSRIDRSRVAELSSRADSRGLDIILNCACGFRAYVEADTLLVIDIGEDLPVQKFAGSREFNVFNGAEPVIYFSDTVLPVVTERHHTIHTMDTIFQIGLQDDNSTAPTKVSKTSEPRASPLSFDNSEKDENALKRVVHEINRAQRQGLLIGVEQGQSSEGLEPPQPSASLVSNIRMRRSGWDDDTAGLANDDLSTDGTACPPADWFDIAEWAHPQGFSAGVGEWSLRLTKEFDVIDDDAALSLARHYLHFGFGAEADATLRLLGEVSPQRETLSALARIIDEGHDTEKAILSDMMSCNGPAALWSTLSFAQLPRHADISVSDVRLSFDALPRHLRVQLAPVLAKKLSAAGKPDVAEAVLATLSFTSESVSPELDLAHARLGIERGDSTPAIMSLENVAQTNSDASSEALMLLVDSAVEKGQTIDQDLVDLVALASFENRRSPLAAELARVHALALAHSGQFAAAFAELAKRLENASDASPDKTASQVAYRLVSHASDMDFLLSILNTPALPLASEVGNAIAQRLMSLGFAEAAHQILQSPADRENQQERRELRAQAELALGRPLEAEAELLGVESATADRLRVQAREMIQDYTAALRGMNTSDSAETRRDLAWLAGDWSALAASGEDSISQIARLALARDDGNAEDSAEPASTFILRQTRDLIANSQESRTLLKELLADFSVDMDATP